MKKRLLFIIGFLVIVGFLLADGLSDFKRFPPVITFALPLFSVALFFLLFRFKAFLNWGRLPLFLAFLLLIASFSGAALLSLRYYVYSRLDRLREQEMRKKALEVEERLNTLYSRIKLSGEKLAERVSSSRMPLSRAASLALYEGELEPGWGISLYDEKEELTFWQGSVFETANLPLGEEKGYVFIGRNLVNTWLNLAFPLNKGEKGSLYIHCLISSDLSPDSGSRKRFLPPEAFKRINLRWLDFREDSGELRRLFEQYGRFFFSRPERGREVLYYPLMLEGELLGVLTIGGLSGEDYIRSFGFPLRITLFLSILLFFSVIGVHFGLKSARGENWRVRCLNLLLTCGTFYGLKFLFPLFPIIGESSGIPLFSPVYFASENPLILSRSPIEFFIGGLFLLLISFFISFFLIFISSRIKGKATALSGMLSGTLALFCLLLLAETTAKDILASSGMNLLQLPLYSLDALLIFPFFGVMFYSISFTFLAFSLFKLSLASADELFGRKGLILIPLIILLIFAIYRRGNLSLAAFVLLILFSSLLVEARVKGWLREKSRATRFLFLFSLFFLSSLFLSPYLVSAHTEVVRGYVLDTLVPQLRAEGELARFLLSRSLEKGLSSPRVRDALSFSKLAEVGTAFTIWRDMPLSSYNSLLAVYDGQGRLRDIFSLNLPKIVPETIAAHEEGIVLKEIEARVGGRMVPLLEGRLTLVEKGKTAGTILALAPLGYLSFPFISREHPYSELIRSSRLDISEEKIKGYNPIFTVYGKEGRFLSSSGEVVLPLPERFGFDNIETSEIEVEKKRYLVFYIPLGGEVLVVGIPDITFRDYPLFIVGFLILAIFIFVVFAFVYFILSLFKGDVFSLSPIRFIRRSFYRRLLFLFVLISGVPILFLNFYLRDYLETRLRMEVLRQGKETVEFARRVVEDHLVAERVKSGEGSSFPLTATLTQAVSGWINRDIDIYFKGKLVASNRRELFSAGILPSRIDGEIYEGLIGRRMPFATQKEEIGGFRYLVVSTVIDLPGEGPAIISIPLTLEEREIRRELADVGDVLLFSSFLLLVIASAVSYSIARRLTKPVNGLTSATEEIARGNFDLIIAPTTEDELKTLVLSFNRMARSLKKQRLALNERKDYIEKILLNATTGIISIDDKGIVTTINPAAMVILSLKGDALGRDISSLFSEECFASLSSLLTRFLFKREKFIRELRLSLMGEVRELQIRGIPLTDEKGDYSGAIFIIEDITEVVRSNRLSLWAEMARIIAHEIKNPLTPIRLAAEHIAQIMKDRPPGCDELVERCLNTIYDQVATLRQLSSNFSTYAKIPQLRLGKTPISPLLSEVVSFYISPRGGRVAVEMDLADDLPPVIIDRELIKRALMNIVENAFEAIKGKGKITLRAKREEDNLLLTIEDTGPGIDDEVKEHLFEPYFSTKASGVGLGLAITKKTIEEHGGEIEIRSEKGKGTRVMIRLPLGQS